MILNDSSNDEAPQWAQDELAELSRPIRDLILKYGGNKAGSFVVMINTKGAGIYEGKPGVDVEDTINHEKFLDEFLADMPNGKKDGLFKEILKDMLDTLFTPEPRKEPTEAQIQWVRDNAEYVHGVYANAGGNYPTSPESIYRDALMVAEAICEPCDCGKRNCDLTNLFNRMTTDLLASQRNAG